MSRPCSIIEYIARYLVKKHNENQSTFCYCPGCGLELCGSKSWSSDSYYDIVRYECLQCGHKSGWLFDTPVPILVEGRVKK